MSETRLPASAMHRTMSPIATAQSRYASGAVAPSGAAMSAGSRKIPPPIVTLTMLAASANVPIERTSEDSDEDAPAVAIQASCACAVGGFTAIVKSRRESRSDFLIFVSAGCFVDHLAGPQLELPDDKCLPAP